MRAKVDALIGSTAREAGVLVLVFATLESCLRGPGVPTKYIAIGILISLIAIASGIILEARVGRRK